MRCGEARLGNRRARCALSNLTSCGIVHEDMFTLNVHITVSVKLCTGRAFLTYETKNIRVKMFCIARRYPGEEAFERDMQTSVINVVFGKLTEGFGSEKAGGAAESFSHALGSSRPNAAG